MKNIFNTLSQKNKIIFLIETWMFVTMAIIWTILVSNNIKPTSWSQRPCFWYTVFGYYCPGCGGTRAFESLLYGKILLSIYYHPFVLYMFLLFILSFISYIIYFITKGNVFLFELKLKYLVYADFILIVYFFIKNLLVFYFGFYLY